MPKGADENQNVFLFANNCVFLKICVNVLFVSQNTKKILSIYFLFIISHKTVSILLLLF